MIQWNKINKLHLAGLIAVIGIGAAIAAPILPKEDPVATTTKTAITAQSNETGEEEQQQAQAVPTIIPATEPVTEPNSQPVVPENTNLEENINQAIEENVEQFTEKSEIVDSTISAETDEMDDTDILALDEEPAPRFYTIGVKHSSVMDIQQRLMDLGFMDDAEPTDYYGSITADALILFQRQEDLKQDGIIGPETLERLMAENAKHYAAKLGMDGEDIRRIQSRLYEMGYLASKDQVTGHFGDVTETAVKEMQANNGLAADGKVGEMTMELLYNEEAKPNLLSYGDQSDVVLECQKKLKELGYLTTTPDGKYGNDTVIAVKQFQSRNDLVVDGFLGPTTREALRSSNAVVNGIMLGDSSDAVKRIQELLSKYGYLSSANMTGYFGEVTEDAVKAFQRNNGLSVDGNVGTKTMAKLTSDNVVKASSNSGSSNSGSTNNNSGSNNSGNTGSSSGNGSSDNGSNSGATSASVSELIRIAKSKVGSPYVYGSRGPNSFDCSGFVYWCLNQVGVKQSYLTSYGWRTVGKYKKITSYSDIKAGDIIVVSGHVGIAAGNGMVIDASSSSGKIVYRSLSSWWSSRFIVAWRIF